MSYDKTALINRYRWYELVGIYAGIALFLGAGVAAGVGLVFGLYPAISASRISRIVTAGMRICYHRARRPAV